MKKKERALLKAARPAGLFLGIELFEDTRIERVAVMRAHYAAVGIPGFEIEPGDADFPLADVDLPDAANTTVILVIFRLHPGEPMSRAFQFRYHHRDSVSPADRLDLRRCRCCWLNDHIDLDECIAAGAAVLPLVQEPMILDLSDLDVTEAFKAIATMPFICVPPTIN